MEGAGQCGQLAAVCELALKRTTAGSLAIQLIYIRTKVVTIRQEAGGQQTTGSDAYVSVIHVEHAGVASVRLFHLRPVPKNQYDSISRSVSYIVNYNLFTRFNFSKQL